MYRLTAIPPTISVIRLDWPEVSEIDVVRHFTRVSQKNHAIDINFYPLGSCTMKYNPKINEAVARYAGFAGIHPYQPAEATVQGALELMYELAGNAGRDLRIPARHAAAGRWCPRRVDRCARSFAPTITSVAIIARTTILVPDSAHGTNPATAAMAGFKVVTIPSDSSRQCRHRRAPRQPSDRTPPALMITNPNTLGLWDENIQEAIEVVHEAGGLVYNDGANFNAILGIVRPGDLGIDIMHFNLHKTFSTPHGGGGPGSGPVGVRDGLEKYLPGPMRRQDRRRRRDYYDWCSRTIRLVVCMPSMAISACTSAPTPISACTAQDGLRQISEDAVLSANYLLAQLRDEYDLSPYDRTCMHEFVLSASRQKANGVKTLDIAKRLLDFGVHPPTTYFPLIVPEALMIEPTETESKESLDYFISAMLQIAEEAENTPEVVTKRRTRPSTSVWTKWRQPDSESALD